MSRGSNRRLAGRLACSAWLLVMGTASAECPQQDLSVTLNTGWDQSTGGVVIPVGADDDDWDVTVDASGGFVPRDAEVVSPNPAWLTFPDSAWIAADVTGPNGTYIYETCWCMDGDFSNPALNFQIRADDQADVLLNGNLVASLPDGTFNDATVPTFNVQAPALFQAGQNCLEVRVKNKYGVVTGFNMVGTVTADDALCCGCDPGAIVDNGSTGVDDTTNATIATGFDDDEWVVTVSASGGTLPRPAEVIDTFPSWSLIPGTKWISADENGPNGVYVYENCWCMDAGYQNPQLDIELLADDRADVFLNGVLLGSTPASNAYLNPPTVLSASGQNQFRAGQNCVTIRVTNVSSVVTGLNVGMSFTADNATCCGCVDIPPDAEGWWPLNETTGIIADEVINNYFGFWSQQFGTPPAPSPAPGMVNGALQLDGVDDYVRVPNQPRLNFGPGEDLSIDAWVLTSTNIRQSIVNKKGVFPTAPGYDFGTSGGVLSFIIGDGTNFAFCNGAINIDDGDFHFVAVTLDRDNPAGIRLYVDGALDTACDPTAVTGDMTNIRSVYFGGDPQFPGPNEIYWEGRLDEIEIFRRALATAEVELIFGAGNIGKCPLDACEDSSGVPVCEGTCDPGFTCLSGPANDCSCVPETQTCDSSAPPTCGGPCPDHDQVCVENAIGNCECQLPPACEAPGGHPECNGICEDSDWVCEDNGQRCHCVPPTSPCELTTFPDCGGTCPTTGDLCEPDFDTMTCKCPDEGGPLFCEGFATYPECDGVCPPGKVCWNNGQRCHCIPEPHCGDAGDYPTCDRPCPAGFVCDEVPGAPFCSCFEDTTACGDTFYPECGGDCPVGETCQNIVGSDNCECVAPLQACGNSQYPECDGLCPVNQDCRKTVNQGCSCLTCAVIAPGPLGPVISMAGGKKIRWTPVDCALTYDLYRLVAPRLRDLDQDGLADDYGSCFQDDIIGTETLDLEDPQPGFVHWYLVTAENFVGVGPLGTNSSNQQRQATTACP